MKKNYLTLITLLLAFQFSYAQWTASGANIYNSNTGNVGIGTTNPTTLLTLNSASGAGVVWQTGGSNIAGLSVNTNSTLWNGGGGIAMYLVATTADINFQTGSPAIETMVIKNSGNVGIGTITPQYKLDVYGTIHAHQVNVDLTGTPDYVFNKDYRLPTLTETEAYIAQNHHLAEIPSADEIAKNGLNLGEMNKMLLKKVEELTLYLIEKDKQVNEQQKINQAFREQLNDLTEQLKALKAYGSPKSIK